MNQFIGQNSAAAGLAYQQYAGAQASTAPTPAPQTLARAVSRVDELNTRLSKLREDMTQIASILGGPFPAGVSASGNPAQTSVVGQLNDNIDFAHMTISEIGETIDAMRRSLGAP